MMERISSLPQQEEKEKKFSLTYTEEHNYARMFSHGCDYLVKKFDDEFTEAFKATETITTNAEV